MKWYCAHIVMFVELKKAPQRQYPVWENIILVEAKGEEEAFEKAECHGRAEEGDDGGTFAWGKSPARWVFAGVRKLTECDVAPGEIESGTELTYTEFQLASLADVKRMAAGKPVPALVNDWYRSPDKKSSRIEQQPKAAKRKRA